LQPAPHARLGSKSAAVGDLDLDTLLEGRDRDLDGMLAGRALDRVRERLGGCDLQLEAGLVGEVRGLRRLGESGPELPGRFGLVSEPEPECGLSVFHACTWGTGSRRPTPGFTP